MAREDLASGDILLSFDKKTVMQMMKVMMLNRTNVGSDLEKERDELGICMYVHSSRLWCYF